MVGDPRKRNRAEAWIYGALNPLTEALEREAALLGLRHVTFNRRSRELERIHALREHLSRGGSLIFDDLLLNVAGLAARVVEHDDRVRILSDCAARHFDALAANQRVLDYARHHFQPVAENLLDVIEDLVNETAPSVSAKPGSYEEAWAKHVDELLRLGDVSTAEELASARLRCREYAEDLLKEFSRLRQELVEAFDVPPAPLL